MISKLQSLFKFIDKYDIGFWVIIVVAILTFWGLISGIFAFFFVLIFVTLYSGFLFWYAWYEVCQKQKQCERDWADLQYLQEQEAEERYEKMQKEKFLKKMQPDRDF